MDAFKKFAHQHQIFLDLRDEWGSHNPEYRSLIRHEILTLCKKATPFLDQATENIVLDLQSPPTHLPIQVSISHCPEIGGFAWSKNLQRQIGLDVEINQNVIDAVVKRVSRPNEWRIAPSAPALWTAKEASFKALFKKAQPTVLSEINILDWRPIGPRTWEFKVQNPILKDSPYLGAIEIEDRLTLGICIVPT